MSETLYDVLGYKGKRSIFKSAFIKGDDFYDNNFLAIEVEPYDDTFVNLYSNMKRYNNAIENIFKVSYDLAIKKGYQGAYIYVYTDLESNEYLLTEHSMRTIYKLI